MSFKYNVILFDENESKVHGIVFGMNYAVAMENLEKYYGNELLKVEIEYYSDNIGIVEIKNSYNIDDILEEVF